MTPIRPLLAVVAFGVTTSLAFAQDAVTLDRKVLSLSAARAVIAAAEAEPQADEEIAIAGTRAIERLLDTAARRGSGQ